ncbi:MAG: diphthamide biosynthesis enzyme Dph2 [Candidatus Freyarchaeota archaeon]|nr:diphthamide biosynthesis enzyme Dph2 [Candidatus Jordarchaeia archaeon]
MEDFDFEIEKIISEVKARNARRVLLQFPEGLLPYATNVASLLEEKAEVEVVTSLDPCWGACDLADYEALTVKADILVHFGHAPWPSKTKVPTLFVECFSTREIAGQAVKVALRLGLKRLILASTIQHVRELPSIKKSLEDAGISVFLKSGSRSAPYPGQVLGCDFSNVHLPNASTVFFIGGGFFHAVGIALFTGKRVISLDPCTGEARDMTPHVKRILLERYAHISRAKAAKKFGVVIGLKSGQTHIDVAKRIKEELHASGKEAYLLAMREVSPERFINLKGIEALVVTACPRIAIEDGPRFPIPVLTLDEIAVVIGRKNWVELYPSLVERGEGENG